MSFGMDDMIITRAGGWSARFQSLSASRMILFLRGSSNCQFCLHCISSPFTCMYIIFWSRLLSVYLTVTSPFRNLTTSMFHSCVTVYILKTYKTLAPPKLIFHNLSSIQDETHIPTLKLSSSRRWSERQHGKHSSHNRACRKCQSGGVTTQRKQDRSATSYLAWDLEFC